MKVNKETKKAITVILAVGAACVTASLMSGCVLTGPEGPSGPQGSVGPTGSEGPVGNNGPQGNQGSPGPVGSPGPTGNTGSQGAPGENCTVSAVTASDVAPNGGSLISCPDGSQSLVLNGTDGQAGTPGTVITPIQFCSGTGSYPSTFPEVGFCINNNLYAVYSANGGFLTEVLPGTWSSDGINNSCTFTVSANCVVTH